MSGTDDTQENGTFLELHRRKVLGGIAGAAGLGAAAAGVRYWSDSGSSGSGIDTQIYVSPDGDDEWSGADPDPPSDGGDSGPFETPERARDAIRELKEDEGLPEDGVSVTFRGGTYRYDESPFELTDEDAGEEGAPIVYRAYEDESVRFIGGIELDSEQFEPVSDEDVRDRLPEGSQDEVVQYDLEAAGIDDYGEILTTGFNLPRSPPNLELFVDGEAMELARWPNEGWVETGTVSDPGGRPRDIKETFTERPLPDEFDEGATFQFTDPRPLYWEDYEDVWVDGYWWNDYAMSNLKVADINMQPGEIITEHAHHYSVREGQRYYYYNVLDELDVPGEFYIDRDTGILYLYSPSPVEDATIELSLSADPIVVMDGVSHVEFSGIDFELCRGSGVQLVDCHDCLIEDATISQVGVMGVLIGDNPSEPISGNNGGTNNGVVGCEIYDTGLGGVKLGGGVRETLEPGENYVTDCDIHDFSRIQSTYTPAVWPTGVGNRIAHNHIHHAPHQAILIGGNEHVIEKNDIHHVVDETSDAGAIYMGRDWSEQGNEIRDNYIHHIDNPSDLYGIGQVGIYLDDLASGTIIEGNVLYETHKAFFIGGGRDNEIRNNLFVSCRNTIDVDDRGMDEDWPHCRTEAEGGTGVMPNRLEEMPYTEEPWSEEYPNLVGLLEEDVNDRCAPANNTVTCNVTVDSTSLEFADLVVELGTVETNLEVAFSEEIDDPGFVDEANQNFALESDSPLLETLECLENPSFEEMEVTEKTANYTIESADLSVAKVDDDTHEIDVTVQNTGRAEAAGTTVVVDNVTSGTTIGDVSTESIPPTDSVDVTLEWDTSDHSEDTLELRATANPDGEQSEQTNTSNSATITVDLPAPPLDLEISPVYGRVSAGETIQLSVPVTNRGTVDSPETTVELTDVTDDDPTSIANLTLSPLEPGEREIVEYDWDVGSFDADTTRSVEATVDPDDELEERSDDNNSTSATEIQLLDPVPENYEVYGSAGSVFGTVDDALAINTNGVDIWEGDDEYSALYDPDVRADGETSAVVTVRSQEDTDDSAKAGLMLRNDVTGDSESLGYAAVMVTPGDDFEFEWDHIADGYMDYAENAGETTYPCWLRLERDGTTVTGSYSTDGDSWTEIASADVYGIADEQDIALFATAGTSSQHSLAEFEEFDVSTVE